MSARFASITAGLLARKGEARPWAPQADKATLAWDAEPVAVAQSRPAVPPPDRARSCAVRMSAHDYERLGILAVKTGSTRQQLLKQALAELLAARSQHLSCACLLTGNKDACEKTCG